MRSSKARRDPGEAAAWDALDAARAAAGSAGRDSVERPDPRPSREAGQQPTRRVVSLGQQMVLSLADRSIVGTTPLGAWLLDELGEYIRPAMVWSLAIGGDAPAAGRLVAPESLKEGRIFSHGSHTLPLAELAGAYEAAPEAMAARARKLGATPLGLGDDGLELSPLPEVPVTLVFWRGDEEFEPRASLLLDAAAEQRLATDLLWALAMYTIRALLGD